MGLRKPKRRCDYVMQMCRRKGKEQEATLEDKILKGEMIMLCKCAEGRIIGRMLMLCKCGQEREQGSILKDRRTRDDIIMLCKCAERREKIDIHELD